MTRIFEHDATACKGRRDRARPRRDAVGGTAGGERTIAAGGPGSPGPGCGRIHRSWGCAAMIYKFRSKAAGDVIMLGPQGDRLLRLLGREPATKGIIEPLAMPAAIAALEAAVAADEAARAAAGPADERLGDPVVLRQRVWPLVEMLRRAHAADEPVVWGV